MICFLIFFDNIYDVSANKTTLFHYFFLKLNSDNNIFLMVLYFLLMYTWSFRYTLGASMAYYMFNDILIKLGNGSVFSINTISVNVNGDLTNGILLIHPICLYTLIIFSLIGLWCSYKFLLKKHVYRSEILFNKTTFIFINILLMLSVYLGCWWAQLELSWGGWWGWDFVELVSLHYLVILTALIHCKTININPSYFFLLFFIKVGFYVFLIKFSYLDSIHNFASLIIFFQNFYEWFAIVLLIYIITIRCKKNYFKFFSTNKNKNFNFLEVLFTTLSFYFTIYVLLEFFLIFFKNFSLNMFFLKNKQIFLLFPIMVLSLIFYKNSFSKINPFMIPVWERLLLQLSIGFKAGNYHLYTFHILLYLLFYMLSLNFLFYNYPDYSVKTLLNDYSNYTQYIDQHLMFFSTEQYVSFKTDTNFILEWKYTLDKNISGLGADLLETTKQKTPTILLLNLFNISFYYVILLYFIFKALLKRNKYLF